MQITPHIIMTLLACTLAASVYAAVTAASVFGNNMVLQQQRRVPACGQGDFLFGVMQLANWMWKQMMPVEVGSGAACFPLRTDNWKQTKFDWAFENISNP